jgi:hypothetical protein
MLPLLCTRHGKCLTRSLRRWGAVASMHVNFVYRNHSHRTARLSTGESPSTSSHAYLDLRGCARGLVGDGGRADAAAWVHALLGLRARCPSEKACDPGWSHLEDAPAASLCRAQATPARQPSARHHELIGWDTQQGMRLVPSRCTGGIHEKELYRDAPQNNS